MVVLCAASALADTKPLLVNPSFNEGLEGWSKNLPVWKVETGAGLNGSKGLVWRSEKRIKAEWFAQNVTLTPGVRYHFGCWAKVQSGEGSRCIPQFALEWMDRDGKYLGGAYLAARDTGGRWTLFEQYSKEIPAEAAKAHLLIFFDQRRDGDIVGDFAFDDFFLKAADLAPLTAAVSSAYRDEVREPGEVKLLASTVRPNDVRQEDFGVKFTWKGPDGADRSRTAVASNAVTAVSLDASEIAFGTNDVLVTAHVRGRGKVGELRFPLARLARPVPRRIYIDRYGRCVKDGRLFFPHGMYFSKATDDMLDAYTNSPFNVIMPYHLPSDDQLDSIARHGLMTFVSMQNDFCRGDRAQYRGLLESKYGRCRRHPALFAWYVFDEAPSVEAPGRTLACDLVREWDPDRPCWSVFCVGSVIPEFLRAQDVLGVDPYPVGEGRPLSAVLDFCRVARAHTCGAKPMWNVPQAFDWGNYRRNQKEAHRMPTEEELRNMNWQHLAAGANGLVSYSFFDIRRQKNAEADWQTVCRVAREIDRFVPVILAEPGPEPKAPPSIAVRTWRKDGAIWVLAVNPSAAEIPAEVVVSGAAGAVSAELGDAVPVLGAGGLLSYRLGRYAVSLVRISRP